MESDNSKKVIYSNVILALATIALAAMTLFAAWTTLKLAKTSEKALSQANKNTRKYGEALKLFYNVVDRFEQSLIREPEILEIIKDNKKPIKISANNLYSIESIESRPYITLKLKNPGPMQIKVEPRLKFKATQRAFYCTCLKTKTIKRFETKEFQIEVSECINRNREPSVNYKFTVLPTIVEYGSVP